MKKINISKFYIALAFVLPIILYLLVSIIFAIQLQTLPETINGIFVGTAFLTIALVIAYFIPVAIIAYYSERKNNKVTFFNSPVWVPGIVMNNIYAVAVALYSEWVSVAALTEPDAGFAGFAVPICWIISTLFVLGISLFVYFYNESVFIASYIALIAAIISLIPLLYFLPAVSEVNSRDDSRFQNSQPETEDFNSIIQSRPGF